jgi:hypothetical protein
MDKNIILDLDNTLICNNTARPHLRDFLNFIFEKFARVCIWTSATKEWLDRAYINILKPNLPINKDFFFMWHREQCNFNCFVLENNMINIFECYKELKFVYQVFPEFKEHNTVIVDDKYTMFMKDFHNGILIEGFEENKYFDFELYRLTIFLFREIINCEDVREIDKINWKSKYNLII